MIAKKDSIVPIVLYNVGMQPDTEQFFLQAYDDYADAIFRHIALRLGDREQARELMQDTYMKVWEYISGGKTVENMRAFLYRVANNLIIDTARRRKLRAVDSLEQMREETGFDPPAEEDHSARTHIDAQRVLPVLQSIDESLRTPLVMRYVDGLAPREIADLLGVSPNVVSVRIHRGMEALRSRLPHEA